VSGPFDLLESEVAMLAHRSTSFFAGLGLALIPLASAHATGSPAGVWVNDTGRGAIEIKPCGDTLCGHVVWLRDETDVKGCGRQIIGEARQAGTGLWDGGWIYSPEKKRKYDVELKPLDDGTLRVKGYAGTKIFSRTMIWTPAPGDLKRCDAAGTMAKADPAPAAGAPVTADRPVPAAPSIATAPAPTEDAAPDAAKTEMPAPPVAAEVPAPADKAPADPEVAEGDEPAGKGGIDMDELADRLARIERETGYGLKKSDNGDCRLKVPFATVEFKCDK